MILLAILIPWLYFFLKGKVVSGAICLLLQITLIGWLPAAIWGVVAYNQDQSNSRHREMMKEMKAQG